MVEDCIHDPRQLYSDGKLRKRTKRPLSVVDSVLGFGEMTPGDLVYGEGSKIDGGFGFAIPTHARETTVLLDSRPTRISTSDTTATSRFSTDSYSSLSSSISSLFRRNSQATGQRSRGRHDSQQQQRECGSRGGGHMSGASTNSGNGSTMWGFDRQHRPSTLSDRVTSSNLRPSQLDLDRSGARASRTSSRPSRLRGSVSATDANGSELSASTWEDVQLNAGPATDRSHLSADGGKNDKIADALGVRRPRRQPSRNTSEGSDLTVINEEDDSLAGDDDKEKDRKGIQSLGYSTEKDFNERSTRFLSGASDADGYRATMNLPPGLTQADIVAICLVQGMVPPGLPPDDTLITWSGPLSPTNPRNWSRFSKWYACLLVSWSTFLANAATNMIAPALGLMSETYSELYIMSIRGMLIASYIFAFTFAPLIFGPMSEILGRKPVLVMGSSLFFGEADGSFKMTSTYPPPLFTLL